MRSYFFLLLFIPLTTLANPPGTIIKYECKHADPKVTNFTCSMNERMTLNIISNKLNSEQKERAAYELAKLGLRYIRLGGRGFTITADFWPKNQQRICSAHKSNSYVCFDCTIKDGSCSPD